MHILIWFLCLLAYGLLVTLLSYGGARLGAVPTVILFALTVLVARALCKSWDEHKAVKARPQDPAPEPPVQAGTEQAPKPSAPERTADSTPIPTRPDGTINPGLAYLLSKGARIVPPDDPPAPVGPEPQPVSAPVASAPAAEKPRSVMGYRVAIAVLAVALVAALSYCIHPWFSTQAADDPPVSTAEPTPSVEITLPPDLQERLDNMRKAAEEAERRAEAGETAPGFDDWLKQFTK